MLISELKWTKRARLAVVVLCVVLGTAGLVVLSQMNQVAEAAILTPIESPPESIFYDDFSGDLSQWTIVDGGWMIKDGQLKGAAADDKDIPHVIYVNTSVSDFVLEAKLKKISGHWGGLMFRGSSSPSSLGEYYLVLLGNSIGGVDSYWIGKRSGGGYIAMVGWSRLNGLDVTVGATVKVSFTSSLLEVYINKVRVYYGDDFFRSVGVFGSLVSGYSDTQWYFDNVNVTVPSFPSAYSIVIRAGVRHIVLTCTWLGSGNITIANLTSPTSIYYEKNMSIYERTTALVERTISLFNIRRAELIIAPTKYEEVWVLYLNVSDVATYTVSVELS